MIFNENILLEVNRIMEIMGVNDDISITILNENDLNDIKNKEFKNLDYIKVPNEVINQVHNSISEISNWPGNFLCGEIKEKIVNGKLRKICKPKFKIKVTDHFLKRLYRLSDNDYMEINPFNKKGKKYNENIVNPEPTEGIFLIKKSLKKIISSLSQIDWSSLKYPIKNFILTDKKTKYHLTFKLEKTIFNYYEITLITQIKGVDFFFPEKISNPIRINEKKNEVTICHLI
jgi:hypothetical protein